jgi:hypothetical protein
MECAAASRARRPLRPVVNRSGTATIHRAIELLIGLVLLGYCAYEIHAGEARGAFRSHGRSAAPVPYWTSLVFELAIAFVFLFGYVEWRE